MRDPVSVVDEQIAAYVAGDTEAFVATYAPDAVCSELPSGRILAQGADGIRERWGAFFAGSTRTFTLVNRIVHGRFVTDHEEVVVNAGERVTRAVAIYQVGPERIERVWFLVDPAPQGRTS